MDYKSKKIAFQIDNPLLLNLKTDSSYLLMLELLIEGYEIYYYEPQDLIYKNNDILVKCKKFGSQINLQNKYSNAQQISQSIEHFDVKQDFITANLEGFLSVFIRQNPPFDMNYITSTYLLDIIKNRGVKIINDSTSVRNCSEKLFVLDFEKFMPQTLITTNYDEAKAFYKDLGEQMILKPLYGYGGDAVFFISKGDKNLFSAFHLLKERYNNIPLICQQYVEEVKTIGDKRIFLVNGEVLFYFARTQASDVSFSSVRLGGGYVKCDLTEVEKDIISTISPKLKNLNLNLVGLDVIGGKYLTEINVTSPTGIIYAQNLFNQNYSKQLVKTLGF